MEIESSIDLNAQTIATAILSVGASVSGISSTASADDDYLPITIAAAAGGAIAGDAGSDADDAGAADPRSSRVPTTCATKTGANGRNRSARSYG